MSVKYHEHIKTNVTPQTEAVPGKPMVANSAGGFTFSVDDWKRLDRFLILGAEGGTYYVAEKTLTRENAGAAIRCLDADPVRAVAQVVAISDAGRAPKNDPAIFVLALAATHAKTEARKAAYDAFPKVCRTGTHLFQFVAAVDALDGWTDGFRRCLRTWYAAKDPEQLAYQVTKYRERNGWSHRDVLRLCSAKACSDAHAAVYRWIVTGFEGMGERAVTRGKGDKAKVRTYPAVNAELLPASIQALESLKKAATASEAAALIERFADKAPRELVPTQFLADPKVWGALLPHMPITATLRNLGAMTRNGLLTPLSDTANTVCERLRNVNQLKKGRVHPLSILVALKTYQSGHGVQARGEGWTPIQQIADALNDAFYLAFDAIEPTGKRWAFGLDVSGSMSSEIAGLPISSCEAVTALALVGARTEPYSFTGLFATKFEDAPFGRNTRLDDAMKYTANRNFGRTDCSLLMRECLARKINVDVFCVMTDNETYAGPIHPFQALKEYRRQTGIEAKLIVVATTSTPFTIADPSDPGMLDVVGFDTAVPAVMADFARNGF